MAAPLIGSPPGTFILPPDYGMQGAPGQPPAPVQTPFQWGAGGAMLTPEAIAEKRKQAQALQAAGLDYSPVGHWTQGLARVADALVGGLQESRLDKAEGANAEHNATVAQSLLGGKPDNAALVAAINDRYASKENRALALWQYQQQNKAPPEPDAFDRALIGAGIDPKSPQGIALYNQRAQTLALPAPQLVGSPETGYRWAQPGGGGAPAPPATLPPDFDFGGQ